MSGIGLLTTGVLRGSTACSLRSGSSSGWVSTMKVEGTAEKGPARISVNAEEQMVEKEDSRESDYVQVLSWFLGNYSPYSSAYLRCSS